MIPTELITLAASTVGAAVVQLFSMRMKMSQLNQALLLERAGIAQAQRMQLLTTVPDTVQWTRRTITLGVVFSTMILPKLAALVFPDMLVTYGWTTSATGILWGLFGDPGPQLVWHEVAGFVITPLDTHFAAMIAGLYFGGSLVRNS